MRSRNEKPNEGLAQWLDRFIVAAGHGDRVPTIRQLKQRFSISQRNIEKVLKPYFESGRLVSRRGSGTVVQDPGHREPEPEWESDLLVLYRISDSRLAHTVLQETEQRLKSRGVSILQMGYSSDEHMLSVLERIGVFKVCLIQIHFEVLSIELLTALKRHAKSIVVDGVSAVGIDADAIGTNWREALSIAFRQLEGKGHRKIGFLTSSHEARQIAMARREFEVLSGWLPEPDSGYLLEIDRLPGAMQIEDIKNALRPSLDENGKLPFTALIVWGVVEGFMLQRALTDLKQDIGAGLSVIMLGSTDFYSEHIEVFNMVGNSNTEKLDTFERVLLERIAFSGSKPKAHYLKIGQVEHGSVQQV